MPSISMLPGDDGMVWDGEREWNPNDAVSLSASGFGVPGTDLLESHLKMLVMGLFSPSSML